MIEKKKYVENKEIKWTRIVVNTNDVTTKLHGENLQIADMYDCIEDLMRNMGITLIDLLNHFSPHKSRNQIVVCYEQRNDIDDKYEGRRQ